MIDYEKHLSWLKEVENAQKNHLRKMSRHSDPYTYGCAEGFLLCYREVMGKLQEFSQPKPKYSEGDKVWTYTHGQTNEWTVTSIYWEKDANDYRVNLRQNLACSSLLESDCYPSKAQLIAAQLKYWESLAHQNYEELYCAPSFEGEIPTLSSCCSVHAGTSEKCHEVCQHEPEMDFGKDSRPRFEKANNPTCRHCGKIYEPEECQHESDGDWVIVPYPERDPPCSIKYDKCIKCGEFY